MKIQKYKKHTDYKTNNTIEQSFEYEPNVPIKGVATIEVFEDGKKVQEAVSDNFIAIGLKHYLNMLARKHAFMPLYRSHNNDASTSNHPLTYMKLTNKSAPESPADDVFATKTQHVVGQVNTGTTSLASGLKNGQVNSTESVFNSRLSRSRLVVDFPTDRANGTFQTIEFTGQDINADQTPYYPATVPPASISRRGILYVENQSKLIIFYTDSTAAGRIKIGKLDMDTGLFADCPLPDTDYYRANALFGTYSSGVFQIWHDEVNNVICSLYNKRITYGGQLDYVLVKHNPDTMAQISIHSLRAVHADLVPTSASEMANCTAVYDKVTGDISFFKDTNGNAGTKLGKEVVTDRNLTYLRTRTVIQQTDAATTDTTSFTGTAFFTYAQNNRKTLIITGGTEIQPIDYETGEYYQAIKPYVAVNTQLMTPYKNPFEFLTIPSDATQYHVMAKTLAIIGAKNVLPAPISKNSSQTMKITYDFFFG